jgi:hypothetical protein
MSRTIASGSVVRTFTCPNPTCGKVFAGPPNEVNSKISRHIRFCEGMTDAQRAFCEEASGRKMQSGLRHQTRLVGGSFQDFSPEVRSQASSAPAIPPSISDEERARVAEGVKLIEQMIAFEDMQRKLSKK